MGNFTEKKREVAIIGAGRVGTALAQALYRKGYRISIIISRTLASANRCAALVNCSHTSSSIQDLPSSVAITGITTSDNAIAMVVEGLAKLSKIEAGALVFHTSGALSSEVLWPLRDAGALGASIHPVQSFAGSKDDWKKLSGAYFGVEGEEQAIVWAQGIVRELGGFPIIIPGEAKTLYHLACAIASNYLVTLMEAPLQMFQELGFSEKETISILRPLLEGTIQNLNELGISGALTGPVSRGDTRTVEGHLQLLAEKFPRFLPLYIVLGKSAIDMGLKKGSINHHQAHQLKNIMGQYENSKEK